MPDEATALRLVGCIETVGNSKLKVDIVHALGQDRYRVGLPSGSWSMSTGMAEVGAPVEPAVAEKLIVLAGVGPGQSSRDIYSFALPGAILTVLGFSQSQEPVRRFFQDLAARVEGGALLHLANPVAQAFSLATDEESLRTLNRLAESKVPEVREAFSRAALMRGSIPVADDLIRRILDPETPAEEREDLAGQMTFFFSKDAKVWARVEALVLDFLAREDRSGDQAVGLGMANMLYQHAAEPGKLMDAVLRVAFRREAPTELREQAVLVLSPGGADRERLRKAFETLAWDGTAPAVVRARAVDRIVEFTPEGDRNTVREDFRKRLPAEVLHASRTGR